MPKLNAAEIKSLMAEVPNWAKKGSAIQITRKFDDFEGSMKFVNAVAKLAEAADHHPDIDIRWDKVTLSLSTHSEGGLTHKDFDLAKQIDRL